MPGIVGLLTRMPRDWAEPRLALMLATMRHASFYNAGTWIDESLGVYLGWVARTGSSCERMPLRNETGDVVLAFSGEDFPDPALKCDLRARGHHFGMAGSSYLVHLAEEPERFFASLNGRFHGLLVDRRRGTSTLFVDRYGMQRLYYHESKKALYFAAEAKAILAVCRDLRSIDPRGLGEFIACGCVLDNRTLFPGLCVLPASSAWVCRGEVVEQRRGYFDPAEWEAQAGADQDGSYERIRDVFSKVLPRYFDGPEAVALSLTGGLDTRMIMAWWKPPAGALPCYSFGGTYHTSQDVAIARRVAAACGQPHREIRVGAEFLSNFASHAERTVFVSDGCAEVGYAPVFFGNTLARHIAPARMTGNYGSQVLRPFGPSFRPVDPPEHVFVQDLSPHFAAARETYNAMLNRHPLSFSVFCQAPWHHYGLYSVELSQLSVRSPFLDNELVRTVFRAPRTALTTNNVCLRLIGDGDPALLRIPTDRGLAGNGGPVAAAIRRAFLESTFKAEYAYDYGMPQWLSRIDRALSPLGPERLFLGRHKYYHFRVWYRDSLASYVREVLLDSRTLSRPIWAPRAVESIVKGHLASGRNFTWALHKLLTLELVHRLLLD